VKRQVAWQGAALWWMPIHPNLEPRCRQPSAQRGSLAARGRIALKPFSPIDSAEEFFYPRIRSKSHFYLLFKLRKARGKQAHRTRKPRAPAKFGPNR